MLTSPRDVTDYESLKSTYTEIRKSMPAISGVTAGAMVLVDSAFLKQRYEDFVAVIRPKIVGTFNLDRLFREHVPKEEALDWFIGFSSLQAVTGNPGQAPYGAGNCYLKALIKNRHDQGLAGSTIDIGRMAAVGYIERALNQKLQDQIKNRSATLLMSETDLYQLFAEAVIAGRPGSGLDPQLTTGLGVVKLEAAKSAFWFSNPRMSMLIQEGGNSSAAGGSAGGTVPVKKLLEAAKTMKDAHKIILGALRARLQVLKFLPEGDANHDPTPLVDLGVDSLVAVDMRVWFQKELVVDIPVMKILGGASMIGLVDLAVELLPHDILSKLEGAPPSKKASDALAEEAAPATEKAAPVAEEATPADAVENGGPQPVILEKSGDLSASTSRR